MLSTYPRFETEAWGNLEMAYFSGEKIVLKSANTTLKFYLILISGSNAKNNKKH